MWPTVNPSESAGQADPPLSAGFGSVRRRAGSAVAEPPPPRPSTRARQEIVVDTQPPRQPSSPRNQVVPRSWQHPGPIVVASDRCEVTVLHHAD
jgi:hypothetical protein